MQRKKIIKMKGSQSQEQWFQIKKYYCTLVLWQHTETPGHHIKHLYIDLWPTDLPATPCGKRREGIRMLVDFSLDSYKTHIFLLPQNSGLIRHKLDKQDVNAVNLSRRWTRWSVAKLSSAALLAPLQFSHTQSHYFNMINLRSLFYSQLDPYHLLQFVAFS